MRIEVHPIYHSLPSRDMEWTAVTSEYEGDWTDPVGYGPTREAAIEDLVWQLEPGTIYEIDGESYFRAPCEHDLVEGI